jgi:putative tryptophan/tyrosine transport system substrate-binding protein
MVKSDTKLTLIVTFAFVLLATPLATEAQQARRMARIGYLSAASPTGTTGDLRRAFSEGLRALGWIEGETIFIEERWAEGKVERLPELAAELVRLKMDVIVAAGAVPVIRAAKQATATIPIVMALGVDPVGQGFISSIRRPGGNITGVAWDPDPAIYGKYPEFLKDMVPKLSRVGAIRDPSEPYVYRKAVEDAASRLGVTILHAEVRSPGELEGAFVTMTGWGAQAVIVYGSSMFRLHLPQIVTLAAKHRLPDVSVWREAVAMGGLMSYGVNIADLYRRAAVYVDRILKGANPADLPVEQPMKFELVLNLKTAKELGLTISPLLLFRADEVIE